VSDVEIALRVREAGAGGLWRNLLALLLPILIVAMELGVYVLEPRVLSVGNLRNILIQSSYLVLFASAQMVVILTRGFDLSLGASVSAISVASALAMTGLDAEGAATWIVV
jgi:ribose transport system permease protein